MHVVSRTSLDAALARLDSQVGDASGGDRAREVSEGLYAVAVLLDREPSLRRALADPASAPDDRRRLVDGLLGSQLAEQPLATFRELVAAPWSNPDDLRGAVDTLAGNAAMRAAEADGVLDDVEDELFRFSRLLEREHVLRSALSDPALPSENKLGIVRTLLGGKAQPATERLVEIAVTRPQGHSLEVAMADLSRLAAERRHRLVADVRVAVPLDAGQTERLATVLARIYGRPVAMQVGVDPEVVGGVSVRVGDEVLDGTVARQLATVRRQLLG